MKKFNRYDVDVDYINMEAFAKDIFGVLKAKRDNMYKNCENEEVKDFVYDWYDDAYINERASVWASAINKDMENYLHAPNHNLTGNLANIEADFSSMVVREYPSRETDNSLWTAIERLDANENTEKAEQDRCIIRKWFWEAFGSCAIAYKFGEEINERVYEFEKDN